MTRRPLFWHIFPWFATVALLSCGLVVAYGISASRRLGREAAQAALKNRLVLFETQVLALAHDSTALGDLFRYYGSRTGTRFTLVHTTGRVLADSDLDPSELDSHGDRPEIIDAFGGDTGASVRYSNSVERSMMYVAVPLRSVGSDPLVLRAAMPLQSVLESSGVLAELLLVVGASVLAAITLLSFLIARRLSRPIEQLTHGAERFAQGDFNQSLGIPAAVETARLAVAMNAMAEQLDERIRALIRKSNEQDAILGAMVEGVIAVDTDERIIEMNAAAAAMLQINGAEATGRYVQEAIRNVALQRFITELLNAHGQLEREIVAGSDGGERTLDVHGTVLRGSRGGVNGVLVVLHDISRVITLENIRRDFVANVSHELRTPLTNIKGFVETLKSGGADDPAQRERFLGIIDHHVNRLGTLIEDLLTISRLEKEEANGGVELTEHELDGVVKNAIEICTAKALERTMRLSIEGARGLGARVNPSLLEQALINLLDNAIKYAAPGTTVHIEMRAGQAETLVAVRDEGPGIAPEHLPRLFERFYRIDKARSSKMGGTGLGLAIVKHIMNVHGGSVSVESVSGNGSTFTLHLPLQHDGKNS